MKQDTTGQDQGRASTDRSSAGQAQPDPTKMQKSPLRNVSGGAPEQEREERGSPNVHMDEGHEDDAAATQGERPKFDR